MKISTLSDTKIKAAASILMSKHYSLLPAQTIVTEFTIYIEMFAVHSSIFRVLSCDVSIDKTSSVIAPLKLHTRFKYCFLQEANLPAVSKETFVLPQFFFFI